MSNPLTEIPIVQRPPTRIVASGTITLAANTGVQVFLGSNGRIDRLQIIITNLDLANNVKVQNLSGSNLATVFPTQSLVIETNADVQVANLTAANVQVEVCELYPDIGNYNGVPSRLAAAIAGGGSPAGGWGTPGGGGGGPPAGGGGGGTFSGGGNRSGGKQTP